MQEKRNAGGPRPYVISDAMCLELVQHMKSIEGILGRSGYVPPWSGGDCPPTFDVVTEEVISGSELSEGEIKAYLKFRPKRGCTFSIRNTTGKKATVSFRDEGGANYDEAKTEFDLAGEPPEISLGPDEVKTFEINSSEEPLGLKKYCATVKLESGSEGGTGNGPNMEIDDP